jgi:hypothetical protein
VTLKEGILRSTPRERPLFFGSTRTPPWEGEAPAEPKPPWEGEAPAEPNPPWEGEAPAEPNPLGRAKLLLSRTPPWEGEAPASNPPAAIFLRLAVPHQSVSAGQKS